MRNVVALAGCGYRRRGVGCLGHVRGRRGAFEAGGTERVHVGQSPPR